LPRWIRKGFVWEKAKEYIGGSQEKRSLFTFRLQTGQVVGTTETGMDIISHWDKAKGGAA
jgi:hypothetical protein